MQVKKKLIIIDSFALIFRAYYAYPTALKDRNGSPINAVYGFTNLFLDILKKFNPEYLVAVFDSEKPTIRSTQFTQYKANRKEADLELINQIPQVARVLQTFDIPVLKVDGYEADDIIGTIVSQMSNNKDIEIIIVTGDQDIFQLVKENIYVYLAGGKFSESKLYGIEQVKEKLGVWPHQITTYKALAGDSSDNIPGVAGIGPKTAIELICTFENIDNIYRNLDKIKESTSKKLQENYEIAMQSLNLATIYTQVPVHFDLNSTKLATADVSLIKSLFTELRFSSLFRKLDEINYLFKNNSDVVEDIFGFDLNKKEIFSLEELIKLNSDVICIEYSLSKSDVVVFDYEIADLCVSNGEKIFTIKKNELNKFFEFCKSKKLVMFNSKPFLHVLYNKFGRTFVQNVQFEDLGFASQILSGGVFGVTKKDTLSYFRINIDLDFYSSTLEGYKIFEKISDQLSQNIVYQLEKKVMLAVLELERSGMAFDKSLHAKYLEIVQKNIDIIKKEIFKEVGFEFNLNSPKQISEVLYDKRGLPVMSKTKTGGKATDETTLHKLKDLDPVVDKILKFREFDKIFSTYVSALPKYLYKDNRIYSTFDQLGAITGRFASKNPNLQNIPLGEKGGVVIRNLFVPSVGYKFISFDYSQQELRILAALAKESKMIDAFNNDVDIHALTASELYDVDISEVTKEQRGVGKVINFSIIYGVSAYGLSENLNLDVSLADELIKQFYSNYPKIQEYFENLKKSLNSQKFLETALGRRRSVENITVQNRFAQQALVRELLNFPIQGTAADLIKEAMVNIYRFLHEYDARLVLQIHDELLFEFKGTNEEEEEFIKQISKAMMNVKDLGVKYKVEHKKGFRWGELE